MLGLLDNKYQASILRKWTPVLEAGPSIDDEYTRLATAMVLETTHRDFVQRGLIKEESGISAGTSGPVGDGSVAAGVLGSGDYHWPSIVIPMVRRIFPTLTAHELVGVQPMNGPIGFAFALRAKYGSNGQLGVGNIDASSYEIGYNNINTGFTGVSGNIGTTVTSGSFWQAYAGAAASTQLDFAGGGQTLANGEYATVNTDYPMAKFDLIKKGVEAKTRKLAANWSPELAEDMMAMHGVDVESEMINILTFEIGAEIDRQLISEQVKAAIAGGMTSTWTPVSADGRNQLERIGTLLTEVVDRANTIAINTRRGAGNFVVASPKVTSVLQRLGSNAFVSANSATLPSVPATGVGALVKVGLINDGSQLLVRDSFAQGNYALVGYKGQHPGDSGIIYCPYIPVQLQHAIKDGSLTPEVGARSRYGVMNSVWEAANYYQFIKIDDLQATALGSDGSRIFLA
jgi:hypothetical protein